MSDLLENELVRKYFGSNVIGQEYPRETIAFKILEAMQTPIQEGERYLYRSLVGFTESNIGAHLARFHPNELRLPDRFQPKEEIEMSPMPCGCRLECENPVHNPAPEPEKCGHLQCVGSKACWKEPQKPDPIAEYRIQFSSHGDSHEAKIDLGAFAEALKPYLVRKQ